MSSRAKPGYKSNKTPNRSNPLSPHAKRKRKREEAEARAKEYAALSTAEKLQAIASRRGESRRERARLLKTKAA